MNKLTPWETNRNSNPNNIKSFQFNIRDIFNNFQITKYI